MANVANPRKQYRFSIQITPDPINPFLFQKVTAPDIEIEEVSHGDTNFDIKTGGRIKVGKLVCEKLMPSRQADNYISSWMDGVANATIGGGVPPEVYKKTIIVTELAEDGFTVVNTNTYFGVWPSKKNGQTFDRMSSDNTIEAIEFSVDISTKQ